MIEIMFWVVWFLFSAPFVFLLLNIMYFLTNITLRIYHSLAKKKTKLINYPKWIVKDRSDGGYDLYKLVRVVEK